MSDQNTTKHALRAAGLCLAVAGAFALPQAFAQDAAPVLEQNSAVVQRDAVTGKLRAATPEEHNALVNRAAKAKIQAMKVAPQPLRNKYHRSGASGVRLTDDFISSATVVRAADGSLVHECVDAAGHAKHAPSAPAASPAPTTVTE